jgi:hypothetical protein
MGNGISINDSDKKSDISRHLREKYEECKLHGASDSELQAQLTDEFNQWMEAYSKAEELKASIIHAEELVSKLAAAAQITSLDGKSDKLNGQKKTKPSLDDKIKDNNSGKHKKVSKLTRRRSFDLKHHKLDLKVQESPVIEVTDVAIAAEPHDEHDHWDSVAAQPYCDICAMAFKSPAFLERHIKFSDIHQRNIAAAENSTVVVADTVPEKGLEGIDYKLIYSGTKLFWRTREEMDVSFYFHLKPSIVEIISHDLQRNKDFKRIYMNHSVLLDLLQSSLESQVGGTDVDKALSRYLISRMQLVTVDDGEKSVVFVPSQTDPVSDALIIDKLPEQFIPVKVARRRRTNGEEIDAMIHAIEEDRAAVSVALNKADSIF